MKWTVFLLTLGFSSCLYAQSPYPKYDLALLVKERTLAVQLLHEATEVETEMNNVLKEAFDENWTISEVKCLLPTAYNKLKKTNPQEYAFLNQSTELHEDLTLQIDYIDGSQLNRIRASSGNPDPVALDEAESYSVEQVDLSYYDFDLMVFDGKKEKYVTTVSFTNSDLAKHDYLFLVQQLQLLISNCTEGYTAKGYQVAETNLKTLANLTTYFLEDYLDDGLASELDKYYEYPSQIVSYKDYVNLILDKKPGTAYLKIFFSRQHNKYMWGMVQTSTGRVLSINECGDYKFTGSFKADNIIRPSYLRSATNVNTQLVNNYYRNE
ncbi:MAG: hypothetical protein ABJN36_09980 [Cyclobacteriaceae bacterium]